MSERVGICWDDDFCRYDFGPGHPFAPIRLQLTMRLAAEMRLFEHANVQMLGPFDPADDAELLRVHEAAYVAAVRKAGEDPGFEDASRGLGTPDDPVFPDMHDAAARIVAATAAAADAVLAGTVQHAVNIAGGLHHAMPGAAEGFCVYNDAAVAIHRLLEAGVERVAYVDVDVHHGDGVQTVFWDDPRVLTISIHESPLSLFPGTGLPSEVGGPGALGTAVNIALPPGTGDQGWLRAFHAVAPQALAAFKPQILVSQQGCDTHFDDPLAHFTKSLDGQRMAYEAVHRWAHRYCGGRWLALGGGGYEVVDVVPRAWTHLMAVAADHPIPPQTDTPQGFRDYVTEALGRPAPGRMTDGRDPWPKSFDHGYDPSDPVDAAVLATRHAAFPHLGVPVDPWGAF